MLFFYMAPDGGIGGVVCRRSVARCIDWSEGLLRHAGTSVGASWSVDTAH